ncbi:MAG: hypothetical protein ABEK50_09095 [bacterium]
MFPNMMTYGLFIFIAIAGLVEMGFLYYRISKSSQHYQQYKQDMEELNRNLEEARERIPEDHYQRQKSILDRYCTSEDEGGKGSDGNRS